MEGELLAREFLHRLALLVGMRELRIQGSGGSKLFAYNNDVYYIEHPDTHKGDGLILKELRKLIKGKHVKTT